MRRSLSILAVALCLSSAAFGQNRDAFEEIRLDPHKAGNVFYMYKHDGIPAAAKPPKGYKAIYISHYGRHGARNHSSESDFDNILRIFRTASEKGLLTERGKEFLRRYEKAYPQLHGRGGELCDRGFEQQYKIAGNMYRNYPALFRKGAKVDAVSTTVPRCIMTMTAFSDQLLRENPRLEIYKQASNSTMHYLNPFSRYNPDVDATDEGYNNRSAYWQQGYRDMCGRLLTPSAVFAPLLTDLSLLDAFGKPASLELAFYEIAASQQCNGQVDDDLLEFIPVEELCRLYECINFRFYCSKGPDTLFQKGRQWAFVWRTLQDIVDKADEDIARGDYTVRLRFGHDIIVMSLLALLDIDGYNKAVGDCAEIKDAFRSYDFPMALNLQFVFYENKAGDLLVRVMYNERDIALPIADCGTPYYYRWSEAKDFFTRRMDLARDILASTSAPPKAN